MEPEIITEAQTWLVNNQGLLINFLLTGSYVNDAPVQNSLLIDFGDIVWAPRIVGLARAKELTFTGRQFGGDLLVVAGYLDQGGKGIIQASLDSGAFSQFGLPGGMVGDSLPAAIGPALDGSYGQVAQSDSPGAAILTEMGKTAATPFDATSPYSMESYDAAALIMLAMQAAGSTDSKVYSQKIMDIANAPGEKILPGEIGKALQLIAEGKDIDYKGAGGDHEFDAAGDVPGSYAFFKVSGTGYESIADMK